MKDTNILIVGVGGQGTLLASRILGQLAMNCGVDVKISEVHGMAQRGGSVVTHVRFGHHVSSPLVERGQADIILAFEKLEAYRWLPYLRDNGILVVNDQEIDPMPVIMGISKYPEGLSQKLKFRCGQLAWIPGMKIAEQVGNLKVTNTALLGALARYLEASPETWQKAIEETVPPKTVEANRKAFSMGYAIQEETK
ncbi:indolepyruvate oxidoreductase subunit beta [Eubacteriales bacterium mix99]|jgi:indolepyruvate ferredoxin oxidoreductase beta subunit|nr:indolepyruvate oxidoreductase subunit beta [Clostridiales bacterium]